MGDLTAAWPLLLCLTEEIVPGSLFKWAAGSGVNNQTEKRMVTTEDRGNIFTVPINKPPAQAHLRGYAVANLEDFQDSVT